jgi:O-glycosyl hydrolase
LSRFGFGADQWPSLDKLWTRESGWNENARNPNVRAAGIPQDISGNMHGGALGQILWGLQVHQGPLRDARRCVGAYTRSRTAGIRAAASCSGSTRAAR